MCFRLLEVVQTVSLPKMHQQPRQAGGLVGPRRRDLGRDLIPPRRGHPADARSPGRHTAGGGLVWNIWRSERYASHIQMRWWEHREEIAARADTCGNVSRGNKTPLRDGQRQRRRGARSRAEWLVRRVGSGGQRTGSAVARTGEVAILNGF